MAKAKSGKPRNSALSSAFVDSSKGCVLQAGYIQILTEQAHDDAGKSVLA